MTNLVDESLCVYCPECNDNKPMTQITWNHLKKHNLTLDQFKSKYPSHYLIHPEKEKQLKELRKKGKEKKKSVFVTKPCWNYKNCNNKVEGVNINVGSIYVICEECKIKGLIHPSLQKHKQRMSRRAKQLNKNNDIIKKRTKTLKNRSQEKIDRWKNKREKTLIKKYGKNWKQTQYEKIKNSMLKKYGKKHALQVPEFLDKARTTHFLKTGVSNPMELKENVDKVLSQRNQKEITEKTIKTNIKKYGGPSPMCSPEIVAKANKTRLQDFLPRFFTFLSSVNLLLLDEYTDCYTYNKYQCLKCNNIFESNWNQIQQGRLCPSCNNKFKPSKGEKEIVEYLKTLGIKNIITNDRTILKPYEVDILLSDYKLCIEYCGLYTHSHDVLEKTRKTITDKKYYHLYKLNECNKHGYNLITIFEDEWLFKKDIVKSMLRQKLGLNTSIAINGRDCTISEITPNAKRDFLNKFHIQGNDKSEIILGAFSKHSELVAVMTFSKPNIAKGSRIKKEGHWELNRFCTNANYRVRGIASKLLKYFQRNYEWTYIYSFADRRWSSGDLYYKLGFALENDPLKIKPNYWYIDTNNLKRTHRFALRLTKKNNPKRMTEQMYRVSQGYGIIYDCGNLKFSIQRELTT